MPVVAIFVRNTYFWSSLTYELSSVPAGRPAASEPFVPKSEVVFSARAGTAVAASPLAFFLRALLDSPATGGFATASEDIFVKQSSEIVGLGGSTGDAQKRV